MRGTTRQHAAGAAIFLCGYLLADKRAAEAAVLAALCLAYAKREQERQQAHAQAEAQAQTQTQTQTQAVVMPVDVSEEERSNAVVAQGFDYEVDLLRTGEREVQHADEAGAVVQADDLGILEHKLFSKQFTPLPNQRSCRPPVSAFIGAGSEAQTQACAAQQDMGRRDSFYSTAVLSTLRPEGRRPARGLQYDEYLSADAAAAAF